MDYRRRIVAGPVGLLLVCSFASCGAEAERRLAQESLAGTNLKRIGLALHSYHADHGSYPTPALSSESGAPLLSWRVAILPKLRAKSLYDRFHLDEPWDSDHNRALIAEMPDVFASPGLNLEKGKTVFLAVTGDQTCFPGDRGFRFSQSRDGLFQTAMVVEAAPERGVEWTRPEDFPLIREAPGAGLAPNRDGKCLLLMGDSSISSIRLPQPDEVLIGIFTATGGESLPENTFE